MTIVTAAEPISIPLSSQDLEQQAHNEAMLLYFTGKTPVQIKALHDTKELPLRRTGNGNGARYELYLDDYRTWVRRLPNG